jgi:hypothetical protein
LKTRITNDIISEDNGRTDNERIPGGSNEDMHAYL